MQQGRDYPQHRWHALSLGCDPKHCAPLKFIFQGTFEWDGGPPEVFGCVMEWNSVNPNGGPIIWEGEALTIHGPMDIDCIQYVYHFGPGTLIVITGTIAIVNTVTWKIFSGADPWTWFPTLSLINLTPEVDSTGHIRHGTAELASPEGYH
jgi:hypothetical protein